jgi:nicotinate phosphoribosyltransferase
MTTLHPEDLALLTDLYELTIAQNYFQEGHNGLATFSLFIRGYPRHRGLLVACGLEDVLRYLEGLCFPSSAIDYLYRTGIFDHDFLGYLKGLRFSGAVWAIPEGRLFFANEPILEVSAHH